MIYQKKFLRVACKKKKKMCVLNVVYDIAEYQ
jgi:hypothetical protein